jgi:stage III sporulation protein SpoIIIAA
VQSGGVPLIVGAHASSAEKLINSGAFEKLHKAEIFDLYVKINVAANGERALEIVRRSDIQVI